jgi:hypothetical protein
MVASRVPIRPTLIRCLIGSKRRLQPQVPSFVKLCEATLWRGGTLLSPQATAEDPLAGFVQCTKTCWLPLQQFNQM